MNKVDNRFELKGIRADKEKITFDIILLCDSMSTRKIFLFNYCEGVLLEIDGGKYNLYTEITEDGLLAELFLDIAVACAMDQRKQTMRMWVRVRIGSTTIEYPVELIKQVQKIGTGYLMPCYVYPISEFKFRIVNSDSVHEHELLNTKTMITNQILCNSVRFEDNAIMLNLVLPEYMTDISSIKTSDSLTLGNPSKKYFALVWNDIKKGTKYFFHKMPVNGTAELEYVLTEDEVRQINSISVNNNVFEWLLIDENQKEYKTAVADDQLCTNKMLSGKDYMSYVYKNQGFLYSNMTNDLTLEICSTDNNNIVFQYSRRSYPVEITEIIAKRVNTDLEYALPFEIINDNDTTVSYRTRLIFEQEEENFRPGVYQFYLTVRDGIYENRISLKTPCNKKLLENIYIIMDYPYTIIGDHYYNCIFYNDTSSNLKCSIQKKFLKTEMLDHDVEEHYLKMHLNIYKEVFFDTNCFFVMTNQNQQLPVVYDFLNETELLYDINVRVDLTRFYEKNKEELIYPMIESGANPGVGMFIQNNYLHPSVSDREAQKFSVVKNIQKMGYRRIWGDYRKGIFLIGVTPDLQFAILQKAVYKDGNVQMAVSFNEKTEKTVQMLSAELIVENVFTGQNIKEKLNISKEVYWAELHIGSLEFGKYNVYVRLANGMRSGLKILQNPESYYDHKAKRKILFQKENGSLNIAVAELLLCENPAQAEFYQNLAESTKKDVKNKNRKIWLIGENYGLSARDTGLAFFEYCEQNHVQEAEVYYVTKKENPDMDYLKPYMNHVIIYDSEEHIKLDALAEFYVVSHGIRDVMPSLYHNRLWEYHKPVVYLQHGVIAMKKIGISNQSYGNSIRKFIVSSEFEKKLLVNNRQFWDDEIAVTGLSRYDKLCIDNNLEQNIVWVMPTWRDWLVSSMEQFVDSRFYKSYSELLCDRSILDLLRRKKHKIVFSLHNDFEKYKPTFEKLACDVVEISDQHEVPMSRRVQECAMIISDYSSIIFDAVYLHKPVLLFQFDQEEYLRSRESYVDLESDLPGQVVHTTGEMIQAMTHLIESDFRAAPSFEEKRRRYFDYEDGCNSERIHQTILTLREEMKDEYEC